MKRPCTAGMTPPMQNCRQPCIALAAVSVSSPLSLLHGFSIAYKMMAIRTCTPPAMLKKTSGTIGNSPNPIGCSPVTGSAGNEPEQK